MAYIPNENRYSQMEYRRCGNSGLKLPLLSLGLWHNFGDTNSLERMAQLCETAFDGGITHFDLANNYAPPKKTMRLLSCTHVFRVSSLFTVFHLHFLQQLLVLLRR